MGLEVEGSLDRPLSASAVDSKMPELRCKEAIQIQDQIRQVGGERADRTASSRDDGRVRDNAGV